MKEPKKKKTKERKEKIEEIIFPLLPYKRPEYRNERDKVARRILELLAEEREQARKEAQREILKKLLSYREGNFIGISFVHRLLEALNSENEG